MQAGGANIELTCPFFSASDSWRFPVMTRPGKLHRKKANFGSGDLSDSLDSGISNLRVPNGG